MLTTLHETVQCSLQAALWRQSRIIFPHWHYSHDVPVPIWRTFHNTGANFMMWKAEYLMLVNLEQCFSTSGSRPHLGSPSDFRGVAQLSTNFEFFLGKMLVFSSTRISVHGQNMYSTVLMNKFVQFISSLFFMMFLGIGIIRTEKCWPNSPTYSTDVGVLRGWVARQKRLRITDLEGQVIPFKSFDLLPALFRDVFVPNK